MDARSGRGNRTRRHAAAVGVLLVLAAVPAAALRGAGSLPPRLAQRIERLEGEAAGAAPLRQAALALLESGWRCDSLGIEDGSLRLYGPRPIVLRIAAVSGDLADSPWQAGAVLSDAPSFLPAARDWLERMDRRGYPFAQLWLRPEADGDSLGLELNLQSGPQGSLGEVRILGLERLGEDFLRKTLDLPRDEPFSMALALRGRERLAASGWFLALDEPLLGWDPVSERMGVVYRVKERPRANRIGVLVGGGSGETTGALNLDFFSPFGGGRRWRLDAQWQGKQRSRLDLDLLEPRLLGRPLALDLGFSRVKQDSTFLQQAVQLDFRLRLPGGWEGVAGIGYERSLLAGGLGESEMNRRRHRFGLTWRSIDPAAPGSRRLSVLTDFLVKHSTLPGEESRDRQLQARLAGLWTQRLAGAWKLRGRGGGDLLFAGAGAGFNAAELAPLGGALTLRGYDEERFRGDRIAYGGIELGYGEPLEIFTFVDYGWGRWRRKDAESLDFSGWGAGLGLLAPAPRGQLSLALALGEEKSLAGLRVHLALDAGF